MPRDTLAWKEVTDEAARLLETRVGAGSFNTEQLQHRRAQEPYPSVSRGISHGGGQTVGLAYHLLSLGSRFSGAGRVVQQHQQYQNNGRVTSPVMFPAHRRVRQLYVAHLCANFHFQTDLVF
jgi:hypothetical protein